eukprot:9967963-Ditylum_brightwellii.AAC.1
MEAEFFEVGKEEAMLLELKDFLDGKVDVIVLKVVEFVKPSSICHDNIGENSPAVDPEKIGYR